MKIATLLRVGQRSIVARWFALLATTGLLLGTVSLKAQTPTETKTAVTTLGGGPQLYNPGSNFGYSNSVYGVLESQFHTPSGLAFDNFQDFLYVADRDNNAVRLIDDSGGIFTFAPYPPYVPTNLISRPVGVAVDALSDVFVLNRGKGTDGTVVEFDYFGNVLATNMTRLTNASAIALDTLGNIYVTASNTVFKITPAGVSNVVVTITNAGAILQGIVVKRSGANAGLLAVCDSGRNGIYLINPTTGAVTTNAGFNGAGDGTGNRNQGVSNAHAQFFQPSGLAEAGDGSLIVADFGNDRVKVVTVSGITTNLYGVYSNDWWTGKTPTGGTAYLGWSDGAVWEPDGGPGFGNVQARMPFGVTVGPDGTVYTTEDYYHIIRKVTAANIQVPPPWPPPAPQGPAATAGYGQVYLTWTASSGATNYNVRRSTSSGVETTIASTTGASYTDTNLLDGTTYFYVVSGLNTGGEGFNSAEVSATPLFSPVPTNLVVTATYFGSISLSWSPSAGATSYNVKRSQSSGGPYTIIATNAAATIYNDTTAVNGTTYYYVVTAVNTGGENPTNSNEVSATPPLPPVPDPQIGYVTFPPPNFTSVFNVGSQAGLTFNNDVPIVIIGTAGSQTFYTYGNTTIATNVPNPATNGVSAPVGYVDGLASVSGLTVAQSLPNLYVKAIGEQTNHPNSAVVSALFQFVVGNPQIIGNNAGQFSITNITAGAQMYYTTDGSDPNPTNPAAVGPISGGATLSLQFPAKTNVLQFEIRGYKANYQPSGLVVNYFSASDFVPNTISFGFASGPGSCKFVASPGQSFTVPVGVTLLPNAPPVYGLQFNVTLTNLSGHVVDPITIGFGSLLGKPDANNDGYYEIIPPYMFVSDTQPNNDPDALPYQGNWYQNLVFSDTNNEDLLGIGWLEVYGRTNLYNTLIQNLLTYPILRGNDPYPSSSQIVGYYTFQIPTNAGAGDVYQIQIGRPSGTTFPGLSINPYGLPVSFAAPADTNLLGPGSVNALKNVTIGSIPYLVGDVYPANWFNAGDFGSSNLVNVDVIRIFDFAAYPIAQPPIGSDLFDALDSCGNIGVFDGATAFYTNAATYPYEFTYTTTNTTYLYTNNIPISTVSDITTNNASIYINITSISAVSTDTAIYYTSTNTETFTTNHTAVYSFANQYVPNLFNGSDTNINQIAFGDGNLDACDVYVTFRRSLDTNNLVWFQRFWTNGMRVATASYAPGIEPASKSPSGGGKVLAAFSSGSSPVSITNAPAVNFTAGDDQATAGQTIQIPVTASVFGPYPLRVALLNISVVPLDGSPALTTPISFSPDPALGTPYTTTSSGNNNFAAVWLDSTIAGLSNNAAIGTLFITIPANATSSSAYAVHFDHASGSPNGLASFPKQALTGLITLSSRNTSTYNDSIPDSWRLRWFGTIYNLLSVSNACPSGDGVNNWAKYVAGVDPNTANDFPSLNPNTPPPSGAAMSVYWPTVSGKQYAILSSASLFPGNWTTNATVTGNGNNMEFDDSSTGAVKFYRVLILP